MSSSASRIDCAPVRAPAAGVDRARLVLGFGEIAGGEGEPGQPEVGLVLLGVDAQRLLERALRPLDVAGRQVARRFVERARRRRLDVRSQEVAHRAFGLRADEAVDRVAVLEQEDAGEAAHAELGGQSRVGVGVDLGQLEAAVHLAGQPLEHRPEHATGSAPVGPEVDQHRNLARRVDDLLLEVLLGDI